jgi:hypothetical protein
VGNTAVAEYDIAHESFIPYNNRRFFCLELSVNERLRRGRRLDYPIKLIKNMWPDVLQEPINPENDLRSRIQEYILRSVVHKFFTPWLPNCGIHAISKIKEELKANSKIYIGHEEKDGISLLSKVIT